MSPGLPSLLRRRGAAGTRTEAAHAHVYPNRTIYGVETPDCYFRRFTPDGKYLLAFNRLLTGLQAFRVGTGCPSTVDNGAGKSEFWQFFAPAWTQTLAGACETLHRDVCLVTLDGRHVIVVRVRRAEGVGRLGLPNTLSCIRAMEDITLVVVDVATGAVADTRTYPSDIVYLSGHNGLSLHGDRLCVVSLKHQCLRLLRVGRDGQLADLQEIGWHTREDDAIYDDTLRIRETRAAAEIARTKRRRGADGCADEAAVASRKRRRVHTAADEPPARNEPPAATLGAIESIADVLDPTTFGRPTLYEEMARLVAQSHANVLDCPESPLPARRPRPNAPGSQPERRPPFLFPSLASAPQPPPRADDEPLLAAPAERPLSLTTLQRLPPQYRLMFTRTMQPARLDVLADSDIAAMEPSLATAPFGGLRQRLLGALFRRAQAAGARAVQHFYRSFRQYEALVLWRAQFLAPTRLLLRFVPLHMATARSHVARAQSASSSMASAFALLAEYDVAAARFLRVWDTGDGALHDEISGCLDVYRVPVAARAQTPSAANDVYLRDSFESAQASARAARSGGHVQAARKASALLPFPPQCLQESPLLNPSVFQCNLRVRQTLEKLRPVSLAPIRFYDRRTGAVKFVLSPTPNCSQQPDDMIQNVDMDVSSIPGARVLSSGAVLMPTGGSDDLDVLDAASVGAAHNGQKTGVVYLFHPTLPLVLSTRSDRGVNAPLPTSNIHFWQPC
ncbi:hypothetical protein IWW55_001986 [Coemansia sp. RSA 2706]|nr:hypothetical protein IWW55_001986 [Coemansia sp. RSA 2706]